MRQHVWQRWLSAMIASLTVVLVTACSDMATATPPPIEDDFAAVVSVTGELVPAVWTSVGPTVGGAVMEILVEEGDTVDAGDVLLRLDSREAALAVRQAEAGLQQAEAELARLSTGPRPEDVTVAAAQVEAARAALTQTIEQRDRLWAGRLDANLAAADAEIAAAQSQELTTRQIHDDMMKCKEVELPDGSTRKICPTLGTYEERARFEWHAALAAVAAAEAGKAVLEPEHWAELAVAGAAIDAAEQQVALAAAQEVLARAEVRAVDVAVAEAGVSQAQAALAAAQLSLDYTVVEAPIGGTVGGVDVRLGGFAAPGIPVVIVGDLSTLRVETTDLDEIDVGRVTPGQTAVVTFDALPDRTFNAKVTRISPVAGDTGGGVNYTVVLELDELDPVLRWGMTAFVDIETE